MNKDNLAKLLASPDIELRELAGNYIRNNFNLDYYFSYNVKAIKEHHPRSLWVLQKTKDIPQKVPSMHGYEYITALENVQHSGIDCTNFVNLLYE